MSAGTTERFWAALAALADDYPDFNWQIRSYEHVRGHGVSVDVIIHSQAFFGISVPFDHLNRLVADHLIDTLSDRACRYSQQALLWAQLLARAGRS